MDYNNYFSSKIKNIPLSGIREVLAWPSDVPENDQIKLNNNISKNSNLFIAPHLLCCLQKQTQHQNIVEIRKIPNEVAKGCTAERCNQLYIPIEEMKIEYLNIENRILKKLIFVTIF